MNVLRLSMNYSVIVGLIAFIFSCIDQTSANQEESIETPESFYSDTILSYSSGKFPNDWDLNRELRGTDKEVLIWKHIKAENRKEFKFCITYKSKVDSSGNEMIFIEEMISEPPYFGTWTTAWIHYAPDFSLPNSVGYYDWLLRMFEHRPTKAEIYEMLDEFKFNLKEQFWMTVEAGIDLELWMNLFGFTPEDYLEVKNC